MRSSACRRHAYRNRSGSSSLLFPSDATYQELREKRNRAASRALFLAAFPCRAGNIEVRPFELAREARKEARRGYGARRTSADIGEVGEVALQLLLVVVPQRHVPGAVVGGVGRRQHFARQRVVVGEEARGNVAERNYAGARQGRDVDDGGGLITLDVGQRVAQDQPAFSV